MGILLADQSPPVIEAVALFAVCAGLILASMARTRSRRSSNRVAQVFWRDVGQAGYLWAGATATLLASALLEVEAVRSPIWLVLALMVGLVCIVIVGVRWHRQGQLGLGVAVGYAVGLVVATPRYTLRRSS